MSLSAKMSGLMTPHAANWYAAEEPWSTIYGLPLRLAPGARRFDTSPAWFGALGSGLTMPWLASLDAHAVESHCVGLANRLRAELDLPAGDSAIVSLPIADAVRVGFHLYNTDDDLDRLVDALR
jgi:hypothetical protein